MNGMLKLGIGLALLTCVLAIAAPPAAALGPGCNSSEVGAIVDGQGTCCYIGHEWMCSYWRPLDGLLA
jgi:hypothetical protein